VSGGDAGSSWFSTNNGNGDRLTPLSRRKAVCSRSGGYRCFADFGFGYALLLGFTLVSSTGTVDCSRVELLTSAP
jgi:hypothetical protein